MFNCELVPLLIFLGYDSIDRPRPSSIQSFVPFSTDLKLLIEIRVLQSIVRLCRNLDMMVVISNLNRNS